MIKTKKVKKTIIEHKYVSTQCDKCKKIFGEEDFLETQEFHYVRFRGGYASVFGDNFDFECDICQHCLKELIGDIIREVTP